MLFAAQVGALFAGGRASHAGYTEIFHDSLASKCFSREKDLEYFFKIWIFMFFTAQFGDLFVGGRSSREGYIEIFATLSRVELPIAKNT